MALVLETASCTLSIIQKKSLSTPISKLVMRLVHHQHQDERETDGAVHWNTMNPKLMRAFGDRGAREISAKDWLPKNSLTYTCAIQSDASGNMIAPDLMGHVTMPYNWKEFVFHRVLFLQHQLYP